MSDSPTDAKQPGSAAHDERAPGRGILQPHTDLDLAGAVPDPSLRARIHGERLALLARAERAEAERLDAVAETGAVAAELEHVAAPAGATLAERVRELAHEFGAALGRIEALEDGQAGLRDELNAWRSFALRVRTRLGACHSPNFSPADLPGLLDTLEKALTRATSDVLTDDELEERYEALVLARQLRGGRYDLELHPGGLTFSPELLNDRGRAAVVQHAAELHKFALTGIMGLLNPPRAT